MLADDLFIRQLDAFSAFVFVPRFRGRPHIWCIGAIRVERGIVSGTLSYPFQPTGRKEREPVETTDGP
jgi:hypothetical protein